MITEDMVGVNYITASEFLKNRYLTEWGQADNFVKYAIYLMKEGKNTSKLPTHHGEVLYSPDDVVYLNTALKTLMGF